MSYDIGLLLVAIACLVVLSAFFSGSETALTAASRARMHSLAQDGDKNALLVNRLLERPEKLLGAVLLGNTLVDVLAAALASSVATSLVGEVGIIYATVAMTSLIVVFGAVLPKTFALAAPDRVSLAVAPIMRALVWVLTPLTILFQAIVAGLLKLTPSTKDDEANILAAHEEIRGTIELQQKEGAVARADAEMLGGVLDLGDLTVEDIMVHRTKMETLDIDLGAKAIIEAILKSQYTRVPLWKDEPENIVGILHSKDLLAALAANQLDAGAIDLAKLVQVPWFVPESTQARHQLTAFLKRRTQMALVVDEYGVVQGLITLEDVLEEIVGQISDEHDDKDSSVRLQADGSVNVDGALAIRDLNRQMNWDLPDDEATTVAGLVIHESQIIPEPGQAFTFHGYRFEVLRRTRNKITALRIRPATADNTGSVGSSVPSRTPAKARIKDSDVMDGG